MGWLNRAAVAAPPSPLNPVTPVPATVMMIPLPCSHRTRSPKASATNTPLPSKAAATLCGPFSCALQPGPPSPLDPAAPFPTTVPMVPFAQMNRTAWFSLSPIQMPRAPKATPFGTFRRAAVAFPPSPVKPALPTPATVVIFPRTSMRRTTWLPASATHTLPSERWVTVNGLNRRDCWLGPPSPVYPTTPSPATVVMMPSGQSLRTRLLFHSAIQSPPSAAGATPLGCMSWASRARPPSPLAPETPVPATVKIQSPCP
jgi:hypothetical protein